MFTQMGTSGNLPFIIFFINLIQYIQREYDEYIMKLYQDDYIDTRDAMLLFTIGDCDEVYFI